MKLNWIKNLQIGSNIKVKESQNKYLVGLKGKVIDETKGILILETKKGVKKIIKSQIKNGKRTKMQ